MKSQPEPRYCEELMLLRAVHDSFWCLHRKHILRRKMLHGKRRAGCRKIFFQTSRQEGQSRDLQRQQGQEKRQRLSIAAHLRVLMNRP